MNTLSIQRPRPSMEIATPAPARAPMKAAEVNCEPWSVLKISGLPNLASASSSAARQNETASRPPRHRAALIRPGIGIVDGARAVGKAIDRISRDRAQSHDAVNHCGGDGRDRIKNAIGG